MAQLRSLCSAPYIHVYLLTLAITASGYSICCAFLCSQRVLIVEDDVVWNS